jgi:hypothetical protein
MILLLATAAHAAFWDRGTNGGYVVGLNVVVSLGAADDRARVGVAASGQLLYTWAQRGELLPAPLFTLDARIGWTHPYVFSELGVLGGAMQPLLIGDGGFLPLIGAQGGAGLQLSTDGSAAPILIGAVVAPYAEARVEAARWQGEWHAPRLMFGPALSLNCCSYYTILD